MKSKKLLYIIFFYSFGLVASKCTEPIDIKDQLSFVDAIVVEASVTNEYKFHEILITRTFQFEDEGPKAEANASVNIVDGLGNTYLFTENKPGEYISSLKFKAIPNTDYQLFITTTDNNKYATSKIQLTNETRIDNIYASKEINSVGTEVMSIFVDSYDPNRNSNYYRYQYEETYKIIAPDWVPEEFLILTDAYGNDLIEPGFEPRSTDEKECYNTVLSNTIIQTSTTDLAEDRVSKFAVRKIAADNAIISHRYSILVKQFVQSLEAYTYYNMLNQLSGEDNLFSQIQPGFINSNIFSVENKNEKVLGFFEIITVSEKRVFFNYTDFFPNEPLPPYFVECPVFSPPIEWNQKTPLITAIKQGEIKYLSDNEFSKLSEGPYWVVPTTCGDCTQIGSSEKPEFWLD